MLDGPLKFAYIQHQVVMKNKITEDENIIAQFIFAATEATHDVVFEPADGTPFFKVVFECLYPGITLSSNVLDAWSNVVNHDEKKKAPGSPFRLFVQTNIMPSDCSKPQYDDLKRMDTMMANLNLALSKNDIKSINEVDLLFMPIVSSKHIYVICFNMKTLKIEILDNSKLGDISKYEYIIVPLKEALCNYMMVNDHPMTSKMVSKKPVRVQIEWRTTKNKIDCGVFTMRHMETSMSTYKKKWVTDFQKEGPSQQMQFDDLRYKYL
ncbi:hypothetical protein M8C21_006643 [Ambrosia artemisiifolia]|uniref:Ubiquitin-like protease family profile domain-containing protein n=1 Tax=Ambrosia artemisiifolia TaxID=4212 RepID=A0AAD5CJT8_AMBAR|nr:hypothetical protein M8C21_006643 [Ambrosia artemisiifolia]